ncbi:MAG: WD40 repeat protein/tRNA A-37 threonylcarbamoyl transferase component Bud32 [Myxococcota bacterium]|jgi:WD40 repeat protein/tRNA A-37 threonylcarbamoyl transferase component Bud32
MGDDKDRPDPDPWAEQGASRPANSVTGWGDLLSAPSTEDDQPHPFAHLETDRYQRQELLGRGGMGRVIAVLDQRLRRRVALKEVDHRTGGSADENARLAREAWITAQLEHPGIVPVYDAGFTDEGRLFYTMRLIQGRSLAEVLGETAGLADRLRLLRPFLDACQAVAYAHSLGIVHRDIKPANIMIGEFGETQVVDWGLARPSDSPRGERWRSVVLPTSDPVRSVQGEVAGTPAYMSPEQASGEPADERSDVWGLGAVLYEVLTGRPPFVGADSGEVLKQLRTRPPEPILTLAPEAPAELIAITRRALHRDPEERYTTARALAADVVRYIDGRTVRAYDYTPTDHLRRFLTAWRVPVAVTAVAALAVLIVGLNGAVRTATERDRAQSAEAEMSAALQQADDNLALALVQQARTAAAFHARPEAEVLAAYGLTLAESPEARGVLAAFDLPRPRIIDTAPVPSCVSSVLSNDGTRLLCAAEDMLVMWDLVGQSEVWSKPLFARWLFFDEANDEIGIAGGDAETLIALSAADGGLLRNLEGYAIRQILFSRDGTDRFSTLEHLHRRKDGSETVSPLCLGSRGGGIGVALSGHRYALLCAENTLDIGGADGLERSIALALPELFGDTASAVDRSPDERWMVVGTLKGLVALIDLRDGTVVQVAETGMGSIRTMTISPDGRLLAIAGERGGVLLWHLDSGAWLGRLPAEWVEQLRFVDNRELLVIGESARRWVLPADLQPLRFTADGGIGTVAFSPDSTKLVTGDAAGYLRVWSVQGEHGEAAAMHWQTIPGVLKDSAFTPDGAFLVGGAINSPGVQVYETDGWTDRGVLMPGEWGMAYPFMRRIGTLRGGLVYGLEYMPSGPEVWRIGEEGTLDHLRVHGRIFWEGESNHTGTAAVLLDEEDRVYLLTDAETLEVVTTFEGIAAADISNTGGQIALATLDNITIISVETGEPQLTIDDIGERIYDIAYSADDRYLAAGQAGGVARIWSAETGDLLAVLRGHDERVASLDFSPDGRWLATGSWDATVRLWGLSALHTPAQELVSTIEDAWGISLEQALSAEVR